MNPIENKKNLANKIFLKTRIRYKIIKILERTGLILKIYKSGKLPKIMKIIPIFKNFEEILWFTRPDTWSPQALFVITRLFLATLKPFQLERFLTMILIPRFQESIFLGKKKLSIHIFMALKIASKYPRSFFSFVITPLLKKQNCTIKESIILSAIISKMSFPLEVISSFLSHFLNKNFSKTKFIILNSILNKNYLLPVRIIDMILDFFVQNDFSKDVSFSQKCFLSFLRNYSCFISKEDRYKVRKKFSKKWIK
ncbi:bystin-like protein [Baffinella frigidus]|nr:bystin-like protein [Cryptophyta sp. CCMP2293]